MEQILIEAVSNQGIWVVLSVFLIVYIIKRNEVKEKEYQTKLSNLEKKYNRLKEIRKNR
ncbi:BhlA-like holin [Mobilisporobacter senegalensis]|uniref:BhlA-like holin n=1 Tax=Mobilisporobacter senegalensis TaxID=1329262 RepID=A0A3N1XR21_9FIRM|nr:BhlA/UviB family holin-like peptide [Mobilisporobacter senegalensis]ROR29124.1 BhlA-like holin [Mobilisporobacter senegalensis]